MILIDNHLTASYDYVLPEALIAQEPASHRTQSRLMIIDRKTGELEHSSFGKITGYLRRGDVLVLNNSRVVPARVTAQRSTGGKVELMILEGWRGARTKVLMRPARRIRKGEYLSCADGWHVQVLRRDGPQFEVEFQGPGTFVDFLERNGLMPVPPYIRRNDDDCRHKLDRQRYQTVYADEPGAVAAPTAGLHFDGDLINRISENGIQVTYITLLVGWGTFKPVSAEVITDHRIETEYFSISDRSAAVIREAKQTGRRIVSVGTTSTRALET